MRNPTPFRSLMAATAMTLACSALLLAGRAHSGPKDTAPTGKITPWAAMKIANAKVPGKALNANFEYDEGHWVYGVMIVTDTTPKTIKEVEIDPTTGKVGDTEDITPAGEGKEMTAELNKALGNIPANAKEADEKDEKPATGKKGE